MLKRLMIALLLFPATLFAETFVEGKDYQTISAAVAHPVTANNKSTVTEFFSYGCPGCYKLEETLEPWLKNHTDKINFDRIPVIFNKSWENYARAYYAAKSLSISDKMDPILFKMIHDNPQSLETSENMINLFVQQGVDKKVAESAFTHSPTIDLLVKQGMGLMAQYQINAVPAFVVNGKYKTDLKSAENPERLVQILDYLLTIKA